MIPPTMAPTGASGEATDASPEFVVVIIGARLVVVVVVVGDTSMGKFVDASIELDDGKISDVMSEALPGKVDAGAVAVDKVDNVVCAAVVVLVSAIHVVEVSTVVQPSGHLSKPSRTLPMQRIRNGLEQRVVKKPKPPLHRLVSRPVALAGSAGAGAMMLLRVTLAVNVFVHSLRGKR
jgi:hypothetical protein